MSENITHTAVVDDCVRLMLASGTICDAFKVSVQGHLDMAHLGCMTRSGDRCNPGLLATFRARWNAGGSPAYRNADGPSAQLASKLAPKLAFVLGWLCHRAADRQMKPIFRRFHPPETRTESPTECSVYHDTFIFGEVYARGAEHPYHPAMFGETFTELTQTIDVGSLQTLTQVLMRRAFIAMHTFIPDVQDPETWLDNLYRLKQDFYVNLQRYDNAINRPDPEKLQRYIIDDNFYDAQEPILATARRLQHSESVSTTQVAVAVSPEPQSHYAQAVHIGYRYLQAASDFFASEMTVDELKTRLDIGKPGRDGVAV